MQPLPKKKRYPSSGEGDSVWGMKRILLALFCAASFLGPMAAAASAQVVVPVPIPVPMLDLVPASPKAPWVDLPSVQVGNNSPWWSQVLLYIPNRVLDLVDVFRVDVGVGPSFGAVVRVTEYGEAGVREMLPMSVRVGDFGRRAPFLLETSNEFGIGPLYVDSSDRKVCPAEVGLGADLLVAGAYAGICFDELLDFAAGLIFIDLKDDDLA